MTTNLVCKEDMELIIKDNDFVHLDIETDHAVSLSIKTVERAKGILLININKVNGLLTLKTKVSEDSDLTVLYWNLSKDLQTVEQTTINTNASYKLAYGELETGSLHRKGDYYLKGMGSAIELISAAIVDAKKQQDLTCHHQNKQTSSLIQTYGVVLTSGDYQVKANGQIDKGASASKSHQVSRVLTFGDKQKATVVPLLMIDENDVEASHAMSIGQLDENQLYYLESRGLRKNEALQLIALGYLMPITKVIDDESLRSYLTKIINEKVQSTCLM